MGRRRTISDERLLAAARAAFVERGPAASTREIARRARISEGVIFQRFGTKTELFFAAMVPPALNLRSGSSKATPPAEALRRIESLVRRLIEYFREATPVLGPLMTHPEFRFEEFARRHPTSSLVALRQELTQLLAAEQQGGNIGPGPVGSMALLFLSLGHTVAVFEHLGAHNSRFPDSLIRGAVEWLWRGVAPASPEKTRR
jgi:AcrR family transcriptional regulator